jgi:hypothetical protein
MTPAIESEASMRAAVAAYWSHRAASEARAAGLFVGLAADLRAAGAADVVLDLVHRAVDDERRHAQTCLAIASHYAGAAVLVPDVAVEPEQRHATCDAEVRAALHATAFCCIQETIACAWLDDCLMRATVPMVRDALRAMLADETHHARLGYAHLASTRVSPRARASAGDALPHLVDRCVRSWLDPETSRLAIGAPEHGVPSVDETRRIVLSATKHVVLPGLAAAGVVWPSGRPEWTGR